MTLCIYFTGENVSQREVSSDERKGVEGKMSKFSGPWYGLIIISYIFENTFISDPSILEQVKTSGLNAKLLVTNLYEANPQANDDSVRFTLHEATESIVYPSVQISVIMCVWLMYAGTFIAASFFDDCSVVHWVLLSCTFPPLFLCVYWGLGFVTKLQDADPAYFLPGKNTVF